MTATPVETPTYDEWLVKVFDHPELPEDDQAALVARARQVREDLTSMFEKEKEVRDRAPGGWD